MNLVGRADASHKGERRKGLIDAHVHVRTPDTSHYPLALGYKREDMKPRCFSMHEVKG